MSTAVFLILFVAFIARVVQSAAAIRNAFVAAAIAIVAIAAYAGVRMTTPAIAIRGTIGLAIACVAMLALGFAIPTLLANAEARGRLARMAAFFAGVLAAAVAADVWWITGGLPMPLYLTPHLWFGAGVACFLIFKARFFEDVVSAD